MTPLRLPARLAAAALAAVLLAGPAAAQTQTVLFPGQTGPTLLASIRAEYRPATLSGTNDNLYADVDRTTVGGQSGVVGVYTGFFVPFDGVPNNDPSQDVFNGGSGINQEHTWPQFRLNGSASARSESDLHNLYPTRVDVNGFRGNAPFAEIPDAQTSVWYRLDERRTTAPTMSSDEYSELLGSTSNATSFEPREDHKGNVARSMFYIAAIYPEEADMAWFAPQQRTLYAWHYQDSITQADQDRSARVAPFQSGKNNPFVLDSTLIRRAFFPQVVVADEAGPALATALRLDGANPFRAEARLELTLDAPASVRAEAFDALGRRVAVLFDGAAPAGPLALRLDGAALAPGIYAVRVVAGTAVLTRRIVRAR